MFMVKASIVRNEPYSLNLALVLAWLVPGAGHWYMGHRGRAVAICLGIWAAFVLGIVLGGIAVVAPQGDFFAKIRFCVQIMCGLPALVVALPTLVDTLIYHHHTAMGVGRAVDLAQVYTGVAGLLNLLCIMDILTLKVATKKTPTPST
jgi:hypothetical protein